MITTEDGWCRYCKGGAMECGKTLCESCERAKTIFLQEVKNKFGELGEVLFYQWLQQEIKKGEQ